MSFGKESGLAWGKLGIIKLFRVGLLLAAVFAGQITSAEPRYVPFEKDSAVQLLKKTVETKMLPSVIKGEGFILTVTKLRQFNMDWEKSQFVLKCAFTAEPVKYGIIKESGEIELVGMGLIAPDEQKMGIKILNITDLKLKGPLKEFNEGIKMVADKSLAGKEYWYGPTPAVSEIMTKDNFSALLKVAIAQNLPWTGSTEEASITFLALHEFVLTDPGKISASFDMKGTHKGMFFRNYAGRASVDVDVLIDPNELAGKIKINKISALKLNGTPRFLDAIVRGLVNMKLKGEELRFSWK